jgi:hypothetical protein
MKRITWASGLVGLSAMLVSGCMGPTYGTDKTANQQLVEDVTGVLSLAPTRSEPIAYNPRPELVRPASTAILPTPQENATRSGDSAWPESPEQRLARIRAEATANQDNPAYRSPVVASNAPSGVSSDADDWASRSPAEQRAEYERRRKINQEGSTTTRRYLSEPPLDYRQPAATAPADDLGEDEWRKERRMQSASGSRSWRDWVPWL